MTRRNSRELNFSLHVKMTILSLNTIFDKNPRECKRFSVRRLLKEFYNKRENKRTLNDFLRKFGTIGSTERMAVFVLFLVSPGRVEI